MLVQFAILFLMLTGLWRDYKRDEGLHRRAKLVNGIMILLLGLFALDMLWQVRLWIHHPETWEQQLRLMRDEELNLMAWFSVFWPLWALGLLGLLSQLIIRNIRAKQIFIYYFPSMFVLSMAAIILDRIALGTAYLNDLMQAEKLGYLLALIILLGFAVGFVIVMERPFMRRFYAREGTEELSTADQLLNNIGK